MFSLSQIYYGDDKLKFKKMLWFIKECMEVASTIVQVQKPLFSKQSLYL